MKTIYRDAQGNVTKTVEKRGGCATLGLVLLGLFVVGYPATSGWPLTLVVLAYIVEGLVVLGAVIRQVRR